MLKLYKFGQIDTVCDASPFCVKVEAYLRLAGIPYETASGAQYLRTAPKGKLPYIEDNGKIVADSSFIIQYLETQYGINPDADLQNTEKAVAHAFKRMLEENLYWVLVHARWALPHNVDKLKQLFFSGIPFPLNKIIAHQARKDVLNKLHQQGLGRHTTTEITDIGNRDLLALANFLGDKTWFLGDKITSLDIVAYASLAQCILVTDFTAPIFDCAKSYENLTAFTHRFHNQLFASSSE